MIATPVTTSHDGDSDDDDGVDNDADADDDSDWRMTEFTATMCIWHFVLDCLRKKGVNFRT